MQMVAGDILTIVQANSVSSGCMLQSAVSNMLFLARMKAAATEDATPCDSSRYGEPEIVAQAFVRFKTLKHTGCGLLVLSFHIIL